MTSFDIHSYLQTIAQISAALVGFSALVLVLGRSPSTQADHVNAVRSRALVRIPLNSLIFSLLPFPLWALGIEDDLVVRIASGLFAVVGIATTFYVIGLNKGVKQLITRYESAHFLLMAGVTVFIIAMMAVPQ